MSKKAEQLGMNPSTASNRLVKDILYSFIVGTGFDLCCKCGDFMSREDFSVEHIDPWLDSDNPVDMYFDLKNVSFSHLSCNVKDVRRPTQKYFTEEEKRAAKRESDRVYRSKLDPVTKKARRKEQYLRTGN